MNVASEWWLLRHGETEWNRAGRLQGRDDSPLTADGRAAAEALARACAGLGAARLWTSPLGRARATAERIGRACGLDPEPHEALAEMSFGECAGLTLDEVRARHPGLFDARARDRWRHRWPGGESYEEVCARVRAWLDLAGPLASAKPAIVVAHQIVNRALLVALGACARDAAMASEQSANVIVRLEAGGPLAHARLDAAEKSAALAWRPGAPAVADGTDAALATQRLV